MDKLKNTRILGVIGIVGLILGIVLPYYTISFFGYTKSVSLWGYWEGKIMMILTIANLLFIFKDYVEKYVPQMFDYNIGRIIKDANPKFSIVPTILVVVFAIYLYTKIDIDTSYVKYGLGFWSLWGGIISLIVYTFLYKKSNLNNVDYQSNIYR